LSYLVAGLLLLAVVRAAETVVDDGEALVNAFVTDVVTFSGDFEQSLIDPDGRLLETTSGTLEIQRPGRFRWVYEEPYEQWLVADGTNIWSYDVDLEQVTVKPQADALANTPALLLGGSRGTRIRFWRAQPLGIPGQSRANDRGRAEECGCERTDRRRPVRVCHSGRRRCRR
jgi:chaperone LolA